MPPASPAPSIPKRALSTLLAASLLITLLATTPTAQAQSNQPPQADAGQDQTFPATTPIQRTLHGTRSFDLEGQTLTYQWEVVTPNYSWLSIRNTGSPLGSEAVFIAPSKAEVERYGNSITFRLTVTNAAGLSHSATVTYRFESPPAASVEVTANLLDPDAANTDRDGCAPNNERYNVNAILARPGEDGNSNIEWDVKEGACLTLRGTATPNAGATDARTLRYRWRKLSAVPNRSDYNVPSSQANRQEFSIMLPDDFQGGRSAILHYSLVVTTASGLEARSTVRINVIDQAQDPKVTLQLADNRQRVQDGNALNPDAGIQRYIVTPGTSVQLIATATDGDAGQAQTLVHTWSGSGVTPSPANKDQGTVSRATIDIPQNAVEGRSYTVRVVVTDSSQRTGESQAVFLVASNTPPEATAPSDRTAEDGPRGGTNNQGAVILTGTGTDKDGDGLHYRWAQVDAEGEPLIKPTVELLNADTDTVSFAAPRVRLNEIREIHLSFTVIDRWGVGDTDTVKVTVLGRNEQPIANAGPDQEVEPGARVSLNGTASIDPNTESSASLRWLWEFTELSTVPSLRERPLDAFDRQALRGFVPGGDDYTDYSELDPLTGKVSSRPYFIAPQLGTYSSIKLTFTLTVTNQGGASHADTVVITITGQLFSGMIDGPDFCTNRSLGGPRTYAFDGDGDGVADTCSLNTTRRATVARQNALDTLASLDRARYRSQVQAECVRLTGNFGDDAVALAADACATNRVSDPPPPVDLARAETFFSGVVSGPDFCVNRSLGGPRTYAFDGDGDGVADTCSLPYTRREAVARQNALETFVTPKTAFDNAVALACREIAETDFGDGESALAGDACA